VPLLVLVRHAKAEAPQAGLDDHGRALTLEGREAAVRLAERLVAAGIVPDLALVSSSNRTVQTFKRMATVWSETPMRIEDDLYESAGERYLSVVTSSGDAHVVLVVGHEPTTSHVAAWLAGPGSLKRPLQKVAQGLTTSGAAILEYDGEWAALDQRTARLVDVIDGKPA
jgi:phosphohistidine phosphatase